MLIIASRHSIFASPRKLIERSRYCKYRYCEIKLNIIFNRSAVNPVIQQHYKSPATQFIMANVNTHLSYTLNYLGKFQEAKKLLNTSVLPIYQQSLPIIQQKDRELLDLLRLIPFKNKANDLMRKQCDFNFALVALGNTQHKLGFINKALEMYQKAFDVFDIAKPLDDISQYYRINVLWGMDRIYVYSRQFVKAEIIHGKARKLTATLPTMQNEHVQSYIYANSSLLMYHLGKFQNSVELLDKSSRIRLAYFSPQHIVHADTQLKLGLINLIINHSNIAKQNFINAEAIYKLYHDDDNIAYIFTNLGFWKTYESLEEYTKALEHMQTTLKIATLQLGKNINSIMSSQLTQAEIVTKCLAIMTINQLDITIC